MYLLSSCSTASDFNAGVMLHLPEPYQAVSYIFYKCLYNSSPQIGVFATQMCIHLYSEFFFYWNSQGSFRIVPSVSQYFLSPRWWNFDISSLIPMEAESAAFVVYSRFKAIVSAAHLPLVEGAIAKLTAIQSARMRKRHYNKKPLKAILFIHY